MESMEKKADNKIIEKKRIYNLYDERIDEERKRLENIEHMKDDLISFNRTLNNCLGLLFYMKGNSRNQLYDEIYNQNALNYSNMIDTLEEEEKECIRNIRKFSEISSKKNDSAKTKEKHV